MDTIQGDLLPWVKHRAVADKWALIIAGGLSIVIGLAWLISKMRKRRTRK